MKKKLVFSGILMLALVLTTGTFAYTYTNTTTASLNGTLADAVWTTYEASENQPDWQQIMPGGQYDSEILLPNAPGDEDEIKFQFPIIGNHWDKVDDMPADDGTTYLSTFHFNKYETDLYNLTDHKTLEDGVVKDIKSISVFFRFSGSTDRAEKFNGYARAVIKINGNIYEGKEEVQTGGEYSTRSFEWRGNPTTGRPWTWEQVNGLQAGISLKADKVLHPASVTQVYVSVNYEKKITQSEVPAGDLFDITPHSDYSGDLQVKIYLTNTAELIKAYSYLNMELYTAKSIESQKPMTFRVLSLENGVVSFNIEGGSDTEYVVEVSGGAYRLVSPDPDDWGTGWSIVPELYCEVTQR